MSEKFVTPAVLNTYGQEIKDYIDAKTPILSQMYDAYTISANDQANGVIFFATVALDSTYSWYRSWSVRYRVTVLTTENQTQGTYEVLFKVTGSTVSYAVFNDFYSTDYRPIYHHALLYPKSSYRAQGAHLGVRIYSARNAASLARTIQVDILETQGCTVTLKDALTKYSSLYNSTYFYYSEYNGTSQGLQESGDADSGQYYLREYTLKAATAITSGNIIAGDSTGFHNLKTGGTFDISYPVLYAGSAISAGSTGSNNYLFHYAISVTTTQSGTYTAYQNVYIKGTLSGNTFTPVSTTPLTQTEPTSDDGYVYYYIGRTYSTTAMTFDATAKKIYIYKDGAFRPYTGYAEKIPTATSSVIGGVTTTSAVTDVSNYTPCPIVSGVPYYQAGNGGLSMTAIASTNYAFFSALNGYLYGQMFTFSKSILFDDGVAANGKICDFTNAAFSGKSLGGNIGFAVQYSTGKIVPITASISGTTITLTASQAIDLAYSWYIAITIPLI